MSNKPPKWIVLGVVAGLGKVQHVIRAVDRKAAEAHWLRAHPGGVVLGGRLA